MRADELFDPARRAGPGSEIVDGLPQDVVRTPKSKGPILANSPGSKNGATNSLSISRLNAGYGLVRAIEDISVSVSACRNRGVCSAPTATARAR